MAATEGCLISRPTTFRPRLEKLGAKVDERKERWVIMRAPTVTDRQERTFANLTQSRPSRLKFDASDRVRTQLITGGSISVICGPCNCSPVPVIDRKVQRTGL
jgi:hypothetical protein